MTSPESNTLGVIRRPGIPTWGNALLIPKVGVDVEHLVCFELKAQDPFHMPRRMALIISESAIRVQDQLGAGGLSVFIPSFPA